MANFLANAGLTAQGINQAQMDQQSLAQQQQQTSKGAISLGDIQRVNEEQAAQRAAVQQSGSSLHDIAVAKADAAQKSGDSDLFQKYATEAMQLPQQTAQYMAESAIRGVNPNEIEANVERTMGPNTMFDKGSLRVEQRADGHVILNSTKNGVEQPARDATAFYSMMAPKVKLGAGETLVSPIPGVAPIASNPKAGVSHNNATYIESGGGGGGPATGSFVTKPSPTETKSNITRTSTNLTPAGTSNPKDLPVFKTIGAAVLNNPNMSTIDQPTGAKVASPTGRMRTALANQLYQSNRQLDPITVANIAVSGKPVINQKTGETAIEYNGKRYSYSAAQSMPTQQPMQQNSQMTPEDVAD